MTNKYKQYSKEELIEELETLKKKKYGLVWDKKNSKETLDTFVNWENVPENFTPKQFPILKEIKNKEIKSGVNKPVNLLIEGDNYHSLAVLNFTHQNKIDVIYIDPPYNTGNKDFIYNDKFIDKEDPFRHSKWLSFMEKRLNLAQDLLKNNGVIFISVDDNEQAQLKLLCDEIFGENNFYGCLTWVKRTKSTNSGKAKKMIQQKIEYILVYGNETSTKFSGFNLLYYDNNKKYPHSGKLGKCRFENLEATDYGRKKRDTMKFPILGVRPRKGRRWQIGKSVAIELVNQKKIELIKGIPMRAVYPEDETSKSFIPFWSHLENTGSAESGKHELGEILGPNHGFDTVKPTPLIKKLLERFDNDITILDFMAGSGTTGQAVLELNSKDNGNRRFILCTNNESKICTNICRPRLKKIINGYENSKGANIKGLGGNLKYFKTSFVGSDSTDKNKRDLVNKSAEMICIKENIFDLIIDKNLKFKIYKKDKKFLGVIFDIDAINDFKKEAEKHRGNFVVYCFSYTEATPEKEFKNLKNKYVLKPIPAVVLRIYLEIFKK